MELIYKTNERPKIGEIIMFSLQQLLAILAATIAVPATVGHGMSQSAALLGAGVGTLVYLIFTKFKSPVFLGSSFAYIGSMLAAFAGGVSMSLGYFGLIIGALFSGIVYVIISIIVKYFGTKWINKIMPLVVIGPTVSIIGFTLAGNAIGDILKYATYDSVNLVYVMNTKSWLGLLCGLVTLISTICISVFGKKKLKAMPFIVGIAIGYVLASIITAIGMLSNNEDLIIVDWSLFNNIKWIPDFTFVEAFFKDGFEYGDIGNIWNYIGTIALAYIPVAFVSFAEHIADHKNLSSVIETNLLEDPGLSRTLLGDGVGSIAGAFFGGCPNTTYGESIGCVAISGNASIITILVASILAIVSSFIGPFVTLLSTIPPFVMGGVCVALYGFISVSGFKMIKDVDLNDNKNLFVVSVILICGVGGLAVQIGHIKLTTVACSLLLGIIVNLIVSINKTEKKK